VTPKIDIFYYEGSRVGGSDPWWASWYTQGVGGRLWLYSYYLTSLIVSISLKLMSLEMIP
jgi:hypothetical protein